MYHDIGIVVVAALVTLLIRALPFVLFSHGQPCKTVVYLGRVLPPAVIAILIVYSLRGVSFSSLRGFAPAFLSVAFTAGLHILKRNTLLSVAGGTAMYMLLLRFMV